MKTQKTGISRRQFLQDAGLVFAGVAYATAATPGKPVETDPDSGAEIVQLTDDGRHTDDIYGEQPYSPRESNRIAVEHAASDKRDGGISIVDLTDGSVHPVVTSNPRFPAFHAWGDYLYYQETVGHKLVLRRCHYQTFAKNEVMELPKMEGRFSYGTVSQDHRYYAVSFHPEAGGSKVLLFDLKTGKRRTLIEGTEYHFKHEQFSRDGRNRVLIQLNQMPEVKEVLLGELEIGGPQRLFPADRPHTPRPTGHEAWVGETGRIFFSAASDPDSAGNVWTAAVTDAGPALAYKGELRFGHVSVSRCGRYWVGDTGEEGLPIYVGSFASGRCKRAVFSRTVYDGQQWSHAHPYLTADNRRLIFTSSRDGHPQVYGARLAEGWLEGL